MRTLDERPALRLLVKRLFISDWTVINSIHLMPNISTLLMNGKLQEIDPKPLLEQHIRHVIFGGQSFTEQELEDASVSWPLLESLAFNYVVPEFSNVFRSRCTLFPSLHTLTFYGVNDLKANMVFPTPPNTLQITQMQHGLSLDRGVPKKPHRIAGAARDRKML